MQHVTPRLVFSQRWLFLFIASMLLVLTGCGGSSPDSLDDPTDPANNPSPASVSVDPVELALDVGQSWNLLASGVYSDGSKESLSGVAKWRSKDPDIVAVNASTGRVTAQSEGTTEIYADWVSSVSPGRVMVTVGGQNDPVSSLAITPASVQMQMGENRSLSVVANYSSGAQRNVTSQAAWETGDSGKLTVSAGKLTTKAPGTVAITARFGGKSKVALVTVVDGNAVTLSSLSITGAKALKVGETLTLGARASYSDGSSKTITSGVTWTALPQGVVTVANGLVTAVGTGAVTVTAEYSGQMATAVINVSASAQDGITLYFKKPSGWATAYAHYWSVAPSSAGIANTTWPGKSMQALSDGWYSVTFAKASSVNVVFNDNGNAKTIDLARTQTGWYVMDELRWYDVDPRRLQVFATPGSGAFTEDGIEVTLSVSGVGSLSARYALGGADPAQSGTPFANGNKVTIGKGAKVGDKFILRVYATNGTDKAEQRYDFEKAEVPDNSGADNFNELRIYQVMVESFQDGDPNRNIGNAWGPSHHRGDLRGIINAIPYIKSLNMNAIWMTPIFNSNGTSKTDGSGYFTYDYFNVDPHFGSNEELRELVQKAHEAGLYVFLDGVFGHHKEGGVAPAPGTGYKPAPNLETGDATDVKYSDSNDTYKFYEQVALHWIDNYDIDGWRLDQAYQIPIPYLRKLREAVEQKCAERAAAGKAWGTLGYMVGEIWDGGGQQVGPQGYGTNQNPGLLSMFDFPSRYRLVQVLATQEQVSDTWATKQPASALSYGFEDVPAKYYPDFAVPNFMLSNHDLVRFGDLIQRAGYSGPDSGEYWNRHKAAFSFMAAFTGPVTVYYGDEIGAELGGFAAQVDKFVCGNQDRCDDHVSRTSGKITGLSTQETQLKEYVARLMQLRAKHPALWDGARTNVLATQTLYADLKSTSSEKVLYVLNTATANGSAAIQQSVVGGSQLVDLETNEIISASSSRYTVPVIGLSGRFLRVQ